jgi:acetyl esterase/lipase
MYIALRYALIAVALLFITNVGKAQVHISLWPKGRMPNSKGLALQDSIHNQRIYRLKKPRMIAFFPPLDDNVGSAVVIFPGGGYQHLTYHQGGFQLAKWFNTLGMSAFVVEYRLPTSADLKNPEIGPLQDAQRAMRIVRANAQKWNVNPDKIGVLGTSAGGHVASTLGTHLKWDVAAIGDSLDHYSFKPDFMILISPVITMGKYANIGSRENLLGDHPSKRMIKRFSNELHVSDQTPPTFMIDAFNDSAVDPHNELLFYWALLNHHVSVSFHVFPKGGHPLHLNKMPGSAQLWPALCKKWLFEMGFLPKSQF